MRIPGFTAEHSTFPAANEYRRRAAGGATTTELTYPAGCVGDCFQDCILMAAGQSQRA